MVVTAKERWKPALISIAFLLSLFGAANTALAQDCSTNCLRVYSIVLSDQGNKIAGTVKLVDETGSGAGVRSSVVHAVWTRPDGSMLDQYDSIGTRLRAEFSLYTDGAPGTYTLTVAGATKPGYTFDPENSALLSETITIAEPGNQPPVAVANADALSGAAPLLVNFDSTGSNDPEGGILAFSWDFGDGSSSGEANPSHSYADIGSFTATLTVTDDMGATASSSLNITVTESNAGCLDHCMSVDQISMSYKRRTGVINGKVWIYDENGNRVRDAGVHAMWSLPDGSTIDDYGATNGRSRATFTLNDAVAGHYDLNIVEVVKDGFTFDLESSNVLYGGIDIVP